MCIYCRTRVRADALAAEPVLPAALGGRLRLERAACPACSARVRRLTDDFLASQFAPTASPVVPRGRRNPSAADWRRAHRAAARILYCYLLLELGEEALGSPPSEILRQYIRDGGVAGWTPRWEVTRPLNSRSPGWHVLSFDSTPPSTAAVGLFGTIWFRFAFDLTALAPHGRLVALDAIEGSRGMAAFRHRDGWRSRAAVRWGWRRS
jgi:hypothetical protein